MVSQGRLWKGVLAPSLLLAACAQGPGPAEESERTANPPAAQAELVEVRLKDVAPAAAASARPLVAMASELVAQRAELSAPRTAWRVAGEAPGGDALSHVRMQQLHDGVRVWGGDLVVHGERGEASLINGQMAQGLGSLDVHPALDAARALQLAKADYAKAAKSFVTQLAYAREASELVVLPGTSAPRGGEARLAWHVVFFTELQAGIAPALSNYFVDAKTGEIIKKWNGIHTLSQASGPGGNAKVARTWSAALDVEQGGAGYIMDTARLSTVDMGHNTVGGTIVSGPLTNIGDAPINDAHGFAEVTLNMLADWGGSNSINGNGFKIVSRVHYSTNYENAFWDGAQMTYGDGATTFYPLSGDIDVVAHEIHHGFTTFHSGLIYSSQSGGMNESFSDIMGTAAEFYSEGTSADWDMGRDIFKGNTALRFLCDPMQDGRSIDHLVYYYEGIDVHYSSGIMNKAFCRAARRLGSGSPTGAATVASVQKLAKAFYTANASYWVPSSTFVQGCQGTMDATAALGWTAAERDALRTSWSESGVYCDGLVEPIVCDETFTAPSGILSSPNYPEAYPNLYRHTWCIKPPEGVTATLHFTAFSTEAGYDFVQVRDAAGATLLRASGTALPQDASATLLAITFTTDQLETSGGFSAIWTTGPNSPPTVAITSPSAGASLSGVVAVTAEASDDSSVARVKFELPDGSVSNDTTAPYGVSWSSTNVVDGASHVIKATAYDNLGVPSSVAQIVVAVANGQQCIQQRFGAAGLPRAIPSFGFYTKATVTGPGNVESLKLSLTILTPSQGEVRVTLTSPSGTTYRVHDRTGGSTDDLFLVDVPISVFNRETAAGEWTMEVSDSSGRGTLYAWSLYVVGTCAPAGYWWASGRPNLPLVNNGRACTSLNVVDDGDASKAKLTISGTHSSRVNLRGTLAHNGVIATAFPLQTFSAYNGPFSFVGRPVSGLSGSALGEWTLCIIDNDAYVDRGTLYNWAIHE